MSSPSLQPMRRVDYPKKPNRSRQDLAREAGEWEELLMLTQAALSVTNTERRVLDRDRPESIAAISQDAQSRSAYEVTVVDRFYQLGQRAFERRHARAVWERSYPTGVPGRPSATDVCLFTSTQLMNDDEPMRETRLEFGTYNLGKLRSDAIKLHNLMSTVDPNYPEVVNLLLLWEEVDTKMTADGLRSRVSKMHRHAGRVSLETTFGKHKPSPATVDLLMVSGVDLFAETEDGHRTAYVGLFKVT